MAKRRYGFDEAKIARFHKEGRGGGHGPDYLPWLTIQDVPSLGRVTRVHSFKTGREHHCLSDLETGLFHLLDWSEAVTDIREQFPLDRDATRRLAGEMGIAHPRESRTSVDLVMTTDFLVDVRRQGQPACAAYSVKPASKLDDPRTLDKLELERRYWASKGVPWFLVTDRDLPEQRILNLAWLHEMRSLDQLQVKHPDYWSDRCNRFVGELSRSHGGLIQDFLQHLERRCGFAVGESLTVLRHLAANKRIGFDLDAEFSTRSPVQSLRLVAPERVALAVVRA
ncbi:TnsA endonuclease N-terminal domain-containing protein [Pseudoxanthomonas mexicana]|uniref:TnsA endonuclease N-terminal domain-containing protein n=1 Tax=Pseudoxanthomonas mexicana TaxID=128785 RepID=UPI0022F3E4C5|nr:TnsA endonuclease N-terminal domain-containing protein [Pseudoxanthomonas mexicana]WBX95213.1 TnsA endonuclease N-terminal domain-containing protein [Pseudoxanthomonas mexicana]